MNKKQLLIFALVVAVAATSWWRYQWKATELHGETDPSTVVPGSTADKLRELATAPSSAKQLPPVDVEERARKNDLGRLRKASSDAAEKVAFAKLRLEALDGQISSLEAQISDIERRGDDPVEHAAEVEPYLRPVLAEFFDAQTQFDEAVAEKAKADTALASALK